MSRIPFPTEMVHLLTNNQTQKNHRELEVIIQECILNAVRESIPIDMILRAYLDETIEDDVIEEIKEKGKNSKYD